MFALTRKWLAERGLGIFRTYCSAGWEVDKVVKWFSADNPGVPLILMGQSGRDRHAPDPDNHAVVVMNGQIVHDPSNAGIIGPCLNGKNEPDWYWLDIVAFAAHSNLTA